MLRMDVFFSSTSPDCEVDRARLPRAGKTSRAASGILSSPRVSPEATFLKKLFS